MAKYYVGLQRSGKKARAVKKIEKMRVIRGPLPGYGTKMSDTLEEFAQPLLEVLPEDASAEELRFALSVASAAWNAEVVGGSAAEELVSRLTPMKGAFEDEDEREMADLFFGSGFEQLRQRKRECFGDDQRFIVGVETFWSSSGDLRFQVASTLLRDRREVGSHALEAAAGNAE